MGERAGDRIAVPSPLGGEGGPEGVGWGGALVFDVRAPPHPASAAGLATLSAERRGL